MARVTLQTLDGHHVEYDDAKMLGQGGMKDVFMGHDGSYVVAWYRDRLDHAGQERLRAITGTYREGIHNRDGGDYWRDLFCWPTGIVQDGQRMGIVAPVYGSSFFFKHGSVQGDILGIKGREKEGKWFASASNRSKYLAPEEKGSWLSYLQVALSISRSVRRLHAAGLAHSDLATRMCWSIH